MPREGQFDPDLLASQWFDEESLDQKGWFDEEIVASPPGGITGTCTASFSLSCAAAGEEKFTGTATGTFSLSCASAGEEKFTGTGAPTLSLSCASSGYVPITGTCAASVLLACTATGSTDLSMVGTVACSFSLACAGEGEEAFVGSGFGKELFWSTSASARVILEAHGDGTADPGFEGSGTGAIDLACEGAGYGSITGSASCLFWNHSFNAGPIRGSFSFGCVVDARSEAAWTLSDPRIVRWLARHPPPRLVDALFRAYVVRGGTLPDYVR